MGHVGLAGWKRQDVLQKVLTHPWSLSTQREDLACSALCPGDSGTVPCAQGQGWLVVARTARGDPLQPRGLKDSVEEPTPAGPSKPGLLFVPSNSG